jgi:replication fork protection complex subunit Tof1/Swi1
VIPYTSDEQADAVTRNPQLKLLFKLLKFTILDQGINVVAIVYQILISHLDADEFEWCIPNDILPEELQRSASIIGKFVETPIDLQGKAAKEMLSKRPRRRRRRSPSPGLSDSDDAADWNGEGGTAASGKDREEREQRKAARKAKNARKDEKSAARKTRQKKEAQVYKSAQFIEDSDADNDDAAFWERERLLRERMNAAASGNLPPAMKATGTRKRKKARESSGKERKKKRAGSVVAPDDPASDSDAGRAEDDALGSPSTRGSSEAPATPHSDAEDASDQATPPPTRSRPKPRPRPRPVRKTIAAASPASSRHTSVAPDTAAEAPSVPTPRRNRVVISDEED